MTHPPRLTVPGCACSSGLIARLPGQGLDVYRDEGAGGSIVIRGYLHRTLLHEGAWRAVGVDLSERMIALARQQAQADGLAGRTRYHQGDFNPHRRQLSDADVTIIVATLLTSAWRQLEPVGFCPVLELLQHRDRLHS